MNKSKKYIDLIIKIVLVIVIIILLLHNCYLMKKNDNKKIPTGNVDIIEINCDKEDTCTVDKDKKKDSNDGKNTESGSIINQYINENDSSVINKSDGENKKNSDKKDDSETKNEVKPDDNVIDDTEPVNEEVYDEDELLVYDTKLKWEGNTSAKIFVNSMYQLQGVIAPESSNTYQFVVKNSTNYDLKYDLSFIETNPYNINMKYKLKKNNSYLIDHYVSASELDAYDVLINSKTSDTYYLEWKWVSSSNDTEIGTNPDSIYGLNIDMKAESVNE